ncbi:unnamed protein product [Dibothriocephalus latus]|uniref:Uncharacterized protein n=1 Tax=Dibothriocephalus latus TaxID=60516 RepID=A0A3P7LS80_DIBLA|nr:unnamed protein product [Dibothriocephalus latus]
MYQEARETTAKAVELTLHEAMKEREKERIQFWREELPRQLDQARAAWLSSPEAQEALSATESVRIRSSLQAEFEGRLTAELTAQQQKLAAEHQLAVQGLKTELDALRSKIPPLITLVSAQTQTESSDTQSLLLEAEDHLSSVLSNTARALLRKAHNVIIEDVRGILTELQLLDKFGTALGSSNTSALSPEAAAEPVQNPLLTLLRLPEDISSPEPVLRCIRGLATAYSGASQNIPASSVSTPLPPAYLDTFREAGAPSPLQVVSAAPKTSRAPNVAPRIELTASAMEALLHIIDAVCTSTQSAFSEDSRKGRPVFSPQKMTAPSASQTPATQTINEVGNCFILFLTFISIIMSLLVSSV